MDKNVTEYVASKIKEFREKRNITQQEVAEYLRTTQQSIARYESGERKADQNILFSLADLFKISINDFFPPLSFDNAKSVDIEALAEYVEIPVLGRIPAGMPFEAIEDQYTLRKEKIPLDWLKGNNEYFALELDGDSMEPEYHDKDIVIFLKCCDCESGQDCCVRINGFDATFKRIKKQENGIMIVPLNEENSTGFHSQFYTNEEIQNKPIEILGIVKQIRRNK